MLFIGSMESRRIAQRMMRAASGSLYPDGPPLKAEDEATDGTEEDNGLKAPLRLVLVFMTVAVAVAAVVLAVTVGTE
eukprot:m.61033 g.61033  ORF g.61033 m.61033 type:complete len:77 (+) comp7320_c0_seq1:890-1120(+)